MTDAAYLKALKMERDRERSARNAKKRAHLKSVVHIDVDFSEAEARDDSPTWISDNGAGVEAIVAHCDGEDVESSFERIRRNARRRLKRAHPELVEVFDLIIENGSNRKESIWTMVSKKRQNGQ
jgi:hypothetical protein